MTQLLTSKTTALIALMTATVLGGCQSSVGGGAPTAQATSSQPAAFGGFKAIGAPTTTAASNYKIGVSDILAISVFQIPELSSSSRQVSGDGTISMPLIGTVKAAGLTPEQLSSQLKSKYGRFVQDPQITISVGQFNSRHYTVDGAINNPGTFPITGSQSSLLSAVASAGGFSSVADPTEITVYRVSGTQRQAARYDAKAIRDGTAPDPEILAGDIIEVGNSAIRSGIADLTQVAPIGGLGVSVAR